MTTASRDDFDTRDRRHALREAAEECRIDGEFFFLCDALLDSALEFGFGDGLSSVLQLNRRVKRRQQCITANIADDDGAAGTDRPYGPVDNAFDIVDVREILHD